MVVLVLDPVDSGDGRVHGRVTPPVPKAKLDRHARDEVAIVVFCPTPHTVHRALTVKDGRPPRARAPFGGATDHPLSSPFSSAHRLLVDRREGGAQETIDGGAPL